MQLWKKNYLITLAVFTLFLSVGISLLVNLIFFEEYQQEIQNTMTEKNTLLSLLSLDETSFSENGSLYFLSDNLKNDGKYLLIASENSRELVNSFPFLSNRSQIPLLYTVMKVFLTWFLQTPWI